MGLRIQGVGWRKGKRAKKNCIFHNVFDIICTGEKIMSVTQTAHLYIEKDPAKYEGKAVIKGTRIPVASIVNHYRSGMSIEEILEGYPSLTASQLFDTLSYYFDNKAEIDKELE